MTSGPFKHSKFSELWTEQEICFSSGSPFLTKATSASTLATNFPGVVVEEWFSTAYLSAKVPKLSKLAMDMAMVMASVS